MYTYQYRIKDLEASYDHSFLIGWIPGINEMDATTKLLERYKGHSIEHIDSIYKINNSWDKFIKYNDKKGWI